MGLLDFMLNMVGKLEEHAPEIVDSVQKVQERAWEKEERKREEVEGYRTRYSEMSNRELQNIIDQGVSGAERAALASIAQERREGREKYKKEYSDMDSFELRIEYKTVSIKKRQGDLDEIEADMRLAIISQILKGRGWYLNSDLEWCDY